MGWVVAGGGLKKEKRRRKKVISLRYWLVIKFSLTLSNRVGSGIPINIITPIF